MLVDSVGSTTVHTGETIAAVIDVHSVYGNRLSNLTSPLSAIKTGCLGFPLCVPVASVFRTKAIPSTTLPKTTALVQQNA